MRHVFGIYEAPAYKSGNALPASSRVQFESWGTAAGGYFDLIAPYFEDYSQRDAGLALYSINVLTVLSGDDLLDAIRIADAITADFREYGDAWEQHLGSEKLPGQPERQVFVTLYKKHLLAIARWLRLMFFRAKRDKQCVVFGNGVCYRMLSGIKLPSGGESYS